MSNKMSKVRVFRGAGKICLIRHKSDGSNSKDPNDIYTSDRTVVDNVATSFSRASEDLNDGNSMWPAATYQTGMTASVTPTFNTVDLDLWAFVTGAKKVVSRQSSMFKGSIEKTIEPVTSGGRIALDHRISSTGVIIVREQWSGLDYIVSAASGFPAASGYVNVDYNTGDMRFHANDTDKVIFISCEFIVPEKFSYELPAMPSNDTFTLILSGENYDKDETDELWDSYTVDSCKATGDIAVPPRQKMPAPWSLTFSLVKPRAGKQAVSWSMCEPASGILKELTLVVSQGALSGEINLQITPAIDPANSYVYQIGAALNMPLYGDILDAAWSSWDGTAPITAASGQVIVIAEITPTKMCVCSGKTTLSTKI